MEILQTIWNALISENTFLVNIVSMPLILIESYLYMLIFLAVLKIQATKNKKITFVVLFSLVSIINSYFGIPPFNNFINVLAMPILVLLIFKTGILKAVLSEIITYIMVILISTILMFAYHTILNVPSTVTSLIPIHRIIFSTLFYICLFWFAILCKKFKINISILDKLKIRNSSLLILNFVIGSLAICIEYYLLFNYIDFMPNFLVFTTLTIITIYFAISIYSLIRTSKLEVTTQNLEEQKLYNQTLTTLHDNIRTFKHDFNNIVQAIGGYLSTNNIDGLRTYYKDLLEECQINNNLDVLNPEIINNPVIYSLLANKYYKAEKLGIKMNLEIMMDLSILNIKMYELTRILGVLFDNAIEAASKCDHKVVNITFRKDLKRNIDLIIIQNTYINKDVNIDRIFEKGYTSKLDNNINKSHGLGLWEVRKYLKNNTDLDLYTTKNEEFFTQQFEIYRNQE